MQQKIIFLHIPKTAGTSMNTIIWNQYKSSTIFHVNSISHGKDMINKLVQTKDSTNVVVGHYSFGLHNYLDTNAKYITLLRNPIDRVISIYYYIKRDTKNKDYKKIVGENISLKEFILNDEYFTQVYNSQTKLIAGVAICALKEKITEQTFITAKENLDKYFLVAGLTERFDETILMMKKELNWSYPVFVKQNITKKSDKKAVITEELKQLIIERNEYDIKLYNYVTEKFNERIETNKEFMEKEMAKFKLKNKRIKPYLIFKQFSKKKLKGAYNKIKKI